MNGWPASPALPLSTFLVGGVPFVPGVVANPDVITVLGYVMTEYAARVEPLMSPGCWGFSFRANANDPNSLSNHASGTAVDVNAPKHPNGSPTSATFSRAQVREVHRILEEVDHAVRWGGDYAGTPDAMHFEINVLPAELHKVAARIRAQQEEDDMIPYREWAPEDKAALAADVAKAVWSWDGFDKAKTKAKALLYNAGRKRLLSRLVSKS